MKMAGIFVCISLFVGSGLAQDVRYNYARDVDFSRYHTYEWVTIEDAAHLGQLADQQLKSAINAELSRKGLVKVDGNADLLLAYQAAIHQEKQFTAYTSGFGPSWSYGPGWGYSGFSSATTTGQTTTIHVGAIGLDIYDAGKHQLIWRGEASKTINPKAKPDKVQKNLEKAVTKLLKNYPPPVKNKPSG